MPPPTISLAMIARDRADGLRCALSSIAAHVDEIIVVDAGGSVDDTVSVARSFGAKVFHFLPADYPEAFYPDIEERFAKHGVPGPFTGRMALADFSAPRNLSFAHCEGDFIFWMDSDDIVRNPGKLRWITEKLEEEKSDSAFLHYEYDFDNEGRCTIRQIRERLVRRRDFPSKVKWEFPIHENIAGLRKGTLFEEVVIVHQNAPIASSVSRAGNLEVTVPHRDLIHYRNLKNLLVEKEKHDERGEELPWRLEYYLGTEMRALDPERAVFHLTKYLAKSKWDEERAQARQYIGHIREMQLRSEEAWSWYAGAVFDFGGNPSPWFGLARIALIRGEWNKVVECTQKGFAQVSDDIIRKPSLTLSPLEWQYRAHVPYACALIELGRFEEALTSAEKGLAVEPGCKYLAKFKSLALERLGRKEAA